MEQWKGVKKVPGHAKYDQVDQSVAEEGGQKEKEEKINLRNK